MGLCDFSKEEVGNKVRECKEKEYTLWLKHNKEYSLINAYNLAVMSILSYSDVKTDKKNPDRDVADFIKKFKMKQKLKSFVKDMQTDTTAVDQFTKTLCKDDKKGIEDYGYMIDNATNTQAFWFVDGENAVLAVRGTQEIKQDAFQIDLDGEQVNMNKIKGQVHLGFKNQAEAIIQNGWGKFKGAIAGKKLFVTGHSLGGAVATILSAYLKEEGYDPLLYTYGSPRVGNEDFVKVYLGIPHYRHVYHHDIVPIVPGRNIDMGTKTMAICGSFGGPLGIYLCSKNWSGTGYYHHGNLCQITSIGSKSIMNSFESHGIVNDRIRKMIERKELATMNMKEIYEKGADTNNDNYISGQEISDYNSKYLKARVEQQKAERILNKPLPNDRKDDTSIVSTLWNGEVSDHFMSEGYLPFLKEEIRTQWKLYKENNCTDTNVAQNPASDTNNRIQMAIKRTKIEIVNYKNTIQSPQIQQTINDQLTAGRLDMANNTREMLSLKKDLLEKAEKDLKRLHKMLKTKIGTHSIYSLNKSELELNKQLDKF